MTDDDDVRAALRALTEDDSPESDPSGSDAVSAATDVLDDCGEAATFVAAGGLADLRRAVAAADRRGDRERARRGREALATLERCRGVAADHFRSGRGTVLGDGGESPDE